MSKMKKYLESAKYQSGLQNTYHMKVQNGQQAMASQSQNSSNGGLKGLSTHQTYYSPYSLQELKKMVEEMKAFQEEAWIHDSVLHTKYEPLVPLKPHRILNPTDSAPSQNTTQRAASPKSFPSIHDHQHWKEVDDSLYS